MYKKTKPKKEKSPEISVHIQLCIYSMPYCLLYSLSNKREHNTWGGKLFVVKEINTEFKHVFLFHILIIFSSHKSIPVFCLLCPDGKCTIKFIQPELMIFL